MKKQTTRKGIRYITGMIVVLVFLSLLIPSRAEAASTNKYLVLVQNKDNTWTAYENLIEKSAQGKLMIKAAPIAEALHFTYSFNKEQQFIIQRGAYRYNTYTYDNARYQFQHSSSSYITKTASAAPYYSTVSTYNLCHFYSLSTLLNCKYYPGSQVTEYKKRGYTSIICYSIYGMINQAPKLSEVVTLSGKAFFAGIMTSSTSTKPTDALNPANADATNYPTNKLIMVGDSRTNNISKWVMPSVETEFIAKSGKGYLWFEQEAIAQINQIKKPGDVILIWLGVNDYFSTTLGGDPVLIYADTINRLAANEWSDCKVYVAEVGFVDANRIYNYYGKSSRTNVTPVVTGNALNGIKDFNDYLRFFLNSNINWIRTNHIIGLEANDLDITPDDLWLIRDNGAMDGLHYSEGKSAELYQYFVKSTMYY